jgi:aldose sugar dehydrogenase
MVRALSLSLALVLAASVAPVAAQEMHRSAEHDFRVVTVADGFDTPWSMTFLPSGEMLVTERPGRLRIVRNGRLLPSPVGGVPEVYARGQGGLLEVAAHPDFSSNRLVYLTYSKPLADGSTTAVIRGRFENDRLNDVEEIFEARSSGNGHYGSRLAFDGNGYLYITVGDRQAPSTGNLEAHPAQDLSNHHGVTIRLHDDGRVPADNPFVDRPGALPEIYSYGHRNAQGLAIHPETGDVWLNEHGPQGGDEVNVVRAGANYGWPVIGYGVNYRSGSAIHEGTHRPGMEQPIHVWVPSIGVSGLTFYTGSQFPGWQGDAFAGGLSGGYLARLDVEDGEIVREEVLLPGIGRVRDVRQGPDGYLYLAVEARDGVLTPILRLEPVTTRN